MRLAAIILGVVTALCPLPSWSAAEDALKAAVIYNMLQYVEWHDEEQRPPDSPLILCANPSGMLWPSLQALNDRPVRRFRLKISEVFPVEGQPACDILIITRPEESLSVAGAERPVLIVQDGAPRGDDVMISLDMVDGRIVFDANHAVARRSGIRMSSKLLRLARSVAE